MTDKLKILFCGDILGQAGRDAIKTYLPEVERKYNPDFIIANGENSAHGFGITDKIYHELLGYGVHVVTTGNHAFDQRSLLETIDKLPNLIRPLNYPENTPGKGYDIFHFPMRSEYKILVVNLMTRVFMDPLNCPFEAMEDLLKTYQMGKNAHAIFVDLHGETASEKMAFAHHFDGRITAVVGTHTHIPTADCRVFDNGTAYQTDVGMTGDYNSVIGMKKEAPIFKFLHKRKSDRMEPADGPATLSACLIEVSMKTGHATNIIPISVGGVLKQLNI